MKELGLVILTCLFLSLAELTEKNIKVLIVLERRPQCAVSHEVRRRGQ